MSILPELTEEQVKIVKYSLKAIGPTLVKGGPGTGKTTMALYRVKEMLEVLRVNNNYFPKILYATYSKTLATYAEQVLKELIEPAGFQRIVVRTVDSIIMGILRRNDWLYEPVEELNSYIVEGRNQFIQSIPLDFQGIQAGYLQALTDIYLEEEITDVLISKNIKTLKEYCSITRPGRKIHLTSDKRTAVWAVYQIVQKLLEDNKYQTWEQLRVKAEEILRNGGDFGSFDAVIIDEAQDLNPSAIKVLARLCSAPNRLFITADTNQSLINSGFNWQDIYNGVKRARTRVLRKNFRSTKQIAEAAKSFLGPGLRDSDMPSEHLVLEGGKPLARVAVDEEEEEKLLVNFLKWVTNQHNIDIKDCAVLAPTHSACRKLADYLSTQGFPAQFMHRDELEMRKPCIKVITLLSCKGLQFKAVALAGMIQPGYPRIEQFATEDEKQEIVERERRVLFVAMTRAMYHLMVIVPKQEKISLFSGFDESLWQRRKDLENGFNIGPIPEFNGHITNQEIESIIWETGLAVEQELDEPPLVKIAPYKSTIKPETTKSAQIPIAKPILLEAGIGATVTVWVKIKYDGKTVRKVIGYFLEDEKHREFINQEGIQSLTIQSLTGRSLVGKKSKDIIVLDGVGGNRVEMTVLSVKYKK